jgi:hypothetical protein
LLGGTHQEGLSLPIISPPRATSVWNPIPL